MQQTEWSPPALGIAACGAFGIILAIGAVTLITDVPGRILVGIAAAGLLVFASLSWRARPKLAISDDGLLTRGWSRSHVLRHGDIKIIRITEFRRLARKVRLLEIDTPEIRPTPTTPMGPLGSRFSPRKAARNSWGTRSGICTSFSTELDTTMPK